MASTAASREERKLMRQRGAANRKVKDVDFGFSFGSPKPEGPKESPARHATANSRPTTQSPRQSDSRSNTRLSLPSVSLSQRTPDRGGSQRSNSGTPRSLRNPLPDGPSVFDLPADDEPERRSPKRRKLSPDLNAHEDESLPSNRAQVDIDARESETKNSQEVTANGAASPTSHPESTDLPNSPELPQHSSPDREQGNEESQPELPIPSRGDEQPNDAVENEDNVENENTQVQTEQTVQRKKKKRKSVVLKPRRSRKSTDTRPQQQPDEPNREDITTTNQEERVEEHRDEHTEEQVGDDGDRSSKQSLQGQEPDKQPKTRKKRTRGVASEQQPPRDSGTKESSEQGQEHPETEHAAENERTKARSESQADKGQPSTTEGMAHRIAQEIQEEEDEEFVPEDESASRAKQRRKGKRRAGSATSQTRRSRQNRQSSERADAEVPATAHESEPQPDQPTTSGKQSKRKSKATGQQQGSPKQRKPRGETVPVVVHRLANVSALDDGVEDDPDRDEHHDSDEPSAKQQYPTRSGVNSADVLAQICSETLERTMSTLENTISQESNSGRRAEWTRKRKAVETFGTELGNRLFDMSEVMESNFVLAAQLKREKKEMATLRNQLMDVRKERGDIAVRIDDVRRKYAEDEKWSREQDTLNNALHDLQLALDRRDKAKAGAAETDPLTGLEFLLRTVAQDVSSTALDSHGGLLNQVRGFNAQLERTASLLDQKQ